MKAKTKTHQRLMAVVLSLIMVLTGSLLVACGGGGTSNSGSSSGGVSGGGGGGVSGGELNVFIWAEYLPDSVVTKFTEETGIKVNVSNYSSNEDLLAKVQSSNEGIYDVVVPSDYMVKMMAEEGLLEELDKDSLPNLSNLDTSFLDPSFDPGNTYSLPYMGGVAMIVYNKNVVTEPITGYEQLFDPQYANSIVALDDFRAVIGMTAKSLGYSLNTTDDAELAQVATRLEELKPNVRLLDSDSPKSAMLSGETSIGYMWNAEVAICQEEDDSFEAVFPSEGCYLFLDNLSVLKGAKNRENALKFINFILEPEVSKMISEEFPYLNPNKAAVALLPDSYRDNPVSNVPAEVIAKGEYVQDLGADVVKYDELWTEFTR
ncbi:MAG: spermidine/putrescine ABC transporter substrate-binding protein [Coriobacteriales bacterium]|jgi:spermidine/putrescine-binding protein|nr:spermidine/putrescine ABC transporter substrate-binding protein [Coriobacteriales bacterium]